MNEWIFFYLTAKNESPTKCMFTIGWKYHFLGRPMMKLSMFPEIKSAPRLFFVYVDFLLIIKIDFFLFLGTKKSIFKTRKNLCIRENLAKKKGWVMEFNDICPYK